MREVATERVTLQVRGMRCGGCAAGVERTLGAAAGVRRAQVALAAGTATVEYEPGRTGPAELAALVAEAGYQVSLQA